MSTSEKRQSRLLADHFKVSLVFPLYKQLFLAMLTSNAVSYLIYNVSLVKETLNILGNLLWE